MNKKGEVPRKGDKAIIIGGPRLIGSEVLCTSDPMELWGRSIATGKRSLVIRNFVKCPDDVRVNTVPTAHLLRIPPDDDPIVGFRTAKLWLDESNGLTLLDVLNSTPEPDGSIKRYVLSIDAEAYNGEAGRKIHAASASTWRRRSDYSLVFQKPSDYQPSAES